MNTHTITDDSMQNSQRSKLIQELTALIKGGNAHATLDDAIADIPADQRTVIPANLPYSIWQLLEHIRIAQKDIVDFSLSSDHAQLAWPDDYWPEPTEHVSDEQWEASIREIAADQKRFLDLLSDDSKDLYEPLPWGTGQNILREAMLIADHNSYHTAEIIVARRLLGIWK